MRKFYFIILITLISIAADELDATTRVKNCRKYWCEGTEGICWIMYQNGNPITCPGRPMWSDEPCLDIEVPPCPQGYMQANNYFIGTDPIDPEIGIGIINGLLYYTNNPVDMKTSYEFEDSQIFNTYSEWFAAVMQQ
jgi:hypothetical protein